MSARAASKRLLASRPLASINARQQHRAVAALRTISTSSDRPANTLPITAHGPPPSPPTTPPYQEHKREKRRFWKHATVSETPEGLQIQLDKRPLKTPGKHLLMVPSSKPFLAAAIAIEWERAHNAEETRAGFRMPLTQMASRAIDMEADDRAGKSTVREQIVKTVMKYLDTDTLLFLAPSSVRNDREGQSLRQLQEEAVTPVLSFIKHKLWPGIEILTVNGDEGILPLSYKQPEESVRKIRGWVESLNSWDLVALERATVAAKSLIAGARLIGGWSESNFTAGEGNEWSIKDAARVVNLEVFYQTSMWGEVEDTHDVEKEDIVRQLGAAVLLVGGTRRS